jgi:hypothetical protein
VPRYFLDKGISMRSSLLLWVCAGLFVGIFPAYGQATECEKIRDVKTLAAAQGYEDSTLTKLEAKYCTAPVKVSEDCSTLTTMHRFAVLGGAEDSMLQIIAKRQEKACASSDFKMTTWPDGSKARASSGAWKYPNGKTAKPYGGGWNYPNGSTAQYSFKAWKYPNGVNAKYSTGQWSDPLGNWLTADDLVYNSCDKVSTEVCAKWSADIKAASGDEKDFLIVEFVVFASTKK